MVKLGRNLQGGQQRASGIPHRAAGEVNIPWTQMSPGVLTLAVLGEDAGGNATDVLLSDAVVVDLGPQAGHSEDVDVPQVGETGQAVFQPLLGASTGQAHQGHLPHPAALVCCQLELGLGTHFGQCEYLGGQEEPGSGENRNLQSLGGHLPLGFTILEEA